MQNPFSAFKDPSRRPRAIIWVAVILIVFFAFYAGAHLFTSTPWFCEEPCHNVHADNTRAFQSSPHSEMGCIACHYKVNMNPLAFALDRVDKLLDIAPTIVNTFEMPLNEFSHMAFVFEPSQCTQCHNIATTNFAKLKNITFAKKQHDAHTAKGITCTLCHNRTAHLEKTPPTLPNNKNHEDWMTMKACFRCHSITDTSPSSRQVGGQGQRFVAPGQCSTCHPRDFRLAPASHDATDWPKAGHGKASVVAGTEAEEVRKEWDAKKTSFYAKQPRLLAWAAGESNHITVNAPPADTIYECSMCHTKRFCDECHSTLKNPPKYDSSKYW